MDEASQDRAKNIARKAGNAVSTAGEAVHETVLPFVKRKPVIGELTSIPPAASRLEVYLKNNKKPGFFARLFRRTK